MPFREIVLESSLNDLYRGAVRAFPETTKRQHATDTIKLSDFRWTPFLGLRTLYVRGLAQNEGREYNSAVVFKGVKYHPSDDARGLVALAAEGKRFLLEPLSLERNQVLVRCSCPDFHWRFQHFDYVDHSLQGPNRKPYEAKYRPGSANPMEQAGICKHVMAMMRDLRNSGLLEE
jgi:hypothetical protein